MNNNLSLILKHTYTKPDLHRRLRLVREYLEGKLFAGASETLAGFLSANGATQEDVIEMAYWGDEFFTQFSRENVYAKLKVLADEANELPILSLYVSYEPNSYETGQLGEWCRKNVDPKLLLELHIDPIILGGCAFVWNGLYRDYSLGYYLRQKKSEIAEIFEKYEKGSSS